MPGITGILQSHPHDPSSAGLLDKMVKRMLHEPFHAADRYENPAQCLHLGWVWDTAVSINARLRWNQSRDIGLLLTGEEFGGAADRLIDDYAQFGTKALVNLNGIFSGLIVDVRQKRSIIFNDRYGLNRIYWHHSSNGFYFASEAKSLLAVLPQLREIDRVGLAESYAVGCVLQNRTLFKGISLLPGASAWVFHFDGRVEKQRYFDPKTWEDQEKLDEGTYSERLVDVFSRILPAYLRPSGHVALSMTGGLDSRMVLAWSRAKPAALPCYTFGGPYRDCADVRIARILAKATNQTHETLGIDDEFFKEFAQLAERTVYLSDGTMDVSGSVELFMNRRARPIAPIRLTGNYGSEILRYNVAFRPAKLDSTLFAPEFAKLLDLARETYIQEAAGNRLSFIAFKQVPWHHYSRRSIECSQLTPRSPFLDNDLVALAYQIPASLETRASPLLNLAERGNPTLANIPTDRALTAIKPVLGRLQRMWSEFTAKAEYAYDYGMPPWLTRLDGRISKLHVEKLFLGRHKFYHFRIWYRQHLAQYLAEIQPSKTGHLDFYRSGAVERITTEHRTARSNHTLSLHKLLAYNSLENALLRTR